MQKYPEHSQIAVISIFTDPLVLFADYEMETFELLDEMELSRTEKPSLNEFDYSLIREQNDDNTQEWD